MWAMVKNENVLLIFQSKKRFLADSYKEDLARMAKAIKLIENAVLRNAGV